MPKGHDRAMDLFQYGVAVLAIAAAAFLTVLR